MTRGGLVLHEHRSTRMVPLEGWQISALRQSVPDLVVTPTVGVPGCFDITPGATVGTIELDGWPVEIRPKIALDRLLFLLSYALDAARWQPSEVDLGDADTLVAAMGPLFAHEVARALDPGVAHGYRSQDEALHTVRGRIRFGDQLRRRYGNRLPVEVTFDDFTDDITENRLLKAAMWRLGRFQLSAAVAGRLRRYDHLLERVTLEQHINPRADVAWSRLNARYRGAVGLARLILSSSSLETKGAGHRAPGLLVNMNRAFEDFVVAALRQAMRLDDRQLVQGSAGHRIHLDNGERVALAPDLSWWLQGRCHLIGDAKYKRLSASGIKHPDLYQLLAYLVATGLPAGVLVYPRTEAEQATHHISGNDTRLLVRTIDLGGSPAQILSTVTSLAAELTRLATPAAAVA